MFLNRTLVKGSLFWQIDLTFLVLTTCVGRIGQPGRQNQRRFEDPREAWRDAQESLSAKRQDGWTDTQEGEVAVLDVDVPPVHLMPLMEVKLYLGQIVYLEGKQNRFWEMILEGEKIATRTGEIGKSGRKHNISHASPVRAYYAAKQLLWDKYFDEFSRLGDMPDFSADDYMNARQEIEDTLSRLDLVERLELEHDIGLPDEYREFLTRQRYRELDGLCSSLVDGYESTPIRFCLGDRLYHDGTPCYDLLADSGSSSTSRKMVPFAVHEADSSNPFAIDLSKHKQKSCPVYWLDHETGFVKIAPSIEAFLSSLRRV